MKDTVSPSEKGLWVLYVYIGGGGGVAWRGVWRGCVTYMNINEREAFFVSVVVTD